MVGEALPLPEEVPPEPSPGATIGPKASVKRPIASSVYDVSDAGVSGILFTYPRTRKTGKKVTDPLTGEEVDEWEAYETLHQLQVIPHDVAQSADWVPASKAQLKMITRKHAAEVDEDGKVVKEAWTEQVPYERPIPAKKIVHYTDWDTEYEYHPKLLKETIVVNRPVWRIKNLYVLSDMKLKKIGGTDSWRLETEDKEDLGAVLNPPVGEDAKGMPVDLHYYYSAEGEIDIVITNPLEYNYPLTVDPSFSFDGTDFVIASAQTEIKTYQNVGSWGLFNGTNKRFNGGYQAWDSDGANTTCYGGVTLGLPMDISDMTDFTISVRTTNGDAAWNMIVRFITDGINYFNYSKALANDVTATYTLSDFVLNEIGSPDNTNITALYIRFEGIDSGKAGNITAEFKDFFTTSPVKTSDIYDSTGRFLLYSEDFEGDDGLALDSYNSNYTVTLAGGASVIEIDDAQAPGGGSTSGLFYTDGVNAATGQIPISSSVDYTRVSFSCRKDNTTSRHTVLIRLAGVAIVQFLLRENGLMRIYYGNGVGGSNIVGPAYVANTNYEIWIDFDFTNNKYRVWIDDVLWPGPNANAQGFDNFFNDGVFASFDEFYLQAAIAGAAGSMWLDDLKAHTGFEDFSALSTPHDIDDITEAVSPAGTDYGRGNWDGDWSTEYFTGPTTAVDAADVVVGTNSISNSGTLGEFGNFFGATRYVLDSSIDISSHTHVRFYMKVDKLTDVVGIQIFLKAAGGGQWTGASANHAITSIVTQVNKWYYIDIAFADFDVYPGTVMDGTNFLNFSIRIWYTTDQSPVAINIDGLHFYGDPAAGTEWQENSLDLNGATFDDEDVTLYNLFQLKDTDGGSTGFYLSRTSTGDNAGIEFADVANAGVPQASSMPLYIDGADDNHRVTFTTVGNTAPTNYHNYGDTWNDIIEFTFFNMYYFKDLRCVGSHYYVHNVTYQHQLNTATVASLDYDKDGGDLQASNIIIDNVRYGVFVDDATNNHVLNNIVLTNVINGVLFATNNTTLVFLNSSFDETDIADINVYADGMIISKQHKKNKWDYFLYTGTNGKSFTNLETDAPDHLPTPNDNFDVREGQLTCGTDGQKNVVYHLSSAAGTVIIISCDAGLVVLDPDLSDVLGTLTETFPLQRGMSTHLPLRPINLPLARPITVSDT